MVSKTNEELSVVCQSDIVFSHPGDDVVLSCHLKPAVSAASMEIQWWHKKEDPVLHCKDGRVTVNIDFAGRVSLSLEDLLSGNVSLTLRDVRSSQKGLYICEVIHESQSIQDTALWTSVLRFLLICYLLTLDQTSSHLFISHLKPVLCPIDIRWFKGTELIYQYKNRQEIRVSAGERESCSDLVRIVHLQVRGPARQVIRLKSREGLPPLMARRQSEGNTGTQELLTVLEDTADPVIVPTYVRTHGRGNPGATVQSIPMEQESSCPAVQSQEQERERPQSHHSTQTSGSPEDRQ